MNGLLQFNRVTVAGITAVFKGSCLGGQMNKQMRSQSSAGLDKAMNATHVIEVELVNHVGNATTSEVCLIGSFESHDVVLELSIGVDLSCK